MKLISILMKNPKIHYILKVFKHWNDKEYIDFFLNREVDPLLLEVKQKGEMYPDHRFYIISENGKGWGFFAEFRVLLAKIIFAERFGFTPVVFWGKEFPYYEGAEINGTKNAFEYYFEPINKYTGEELEKAKYVIRAKSAQGVLIEREYKKATYDISDEYLRKLADVYRRYIHFNENVRERLNKETDSLFQNRKTLGIHFRGTDFKVGYDSHPVSVQIEQEIEEAKKAVREYGFEQIFLATDEVNAIKRFKDVFGERLVYYEDTYRGEGDTSIAFSESDRDFHHYRLGYEVVRDMYSLSLCEGLIAGLSQVVICARVAKESRNEKYEYRSIIDNGIHYGGVKFKRPEEKIKK